MNNKSKAYLLLLMVPLIFGQMVDAASLVTGRHSRRPTPLALPHRGTESFSLSGIVEPMSDSQIDQRALLTVVRSIGVAPSTIRHSATFTSFRLIQPKKTVLTIEEPSSSEEQKACENQYYCTYSRTRGALPVESPESEPRNVCECNRELGSVICSCVEKK